MTTDNVRKGWSINSLFFGREDRATDEKEVGHAKTTNLRKHPSGGFGPLKYS
jgi:hypothetical protein